tara:strand:- start:1485 stop:1754 length:270 start_codon:yes stop_codon:yes gene_type:complete
MIKTQLKLISCGILFLIFGVACLSAVEEKEPIPIEERDSDIPCQNLDVLDSVDYILHWEIINDTLHIYTKDDEIKDERERWEYIKSLEE